MQRRRYRVILITPSARLTVALALALALGACAAATGCGDDDSGKNNENSNGGQVCGDGVLDPGEQCDEGPANSDTAPDACRTDCRTAYCGDGVLDTGEPCDGAALGGHGCADVGEFDGGALGCAADCTFDVTDCTWCGDGVAEGDESCDGTDIGTANCSSLQAGQAGIVTCTAACEYDTTGCYTCGDGTVEPAEQCEASSYQTCQQQGYSGGLEACIMCQLVGACSSACGNALVEPDEECDGADLAGETCASQGFHDGTLRCSPSCKLNAADCTHCGNGILDAGEQCDANDLGGQSCASVLGAGFAGTPSCTPRCELDLSTCTAPATCGNGQLEPVNDESCDGSDLGGWTCATLDPLRYDGGTLACNTNCTFDATGCHEIEVDPCGNGVAEPAFGEQCDGADLGGQTCAGLGYPGGALACTAQCGFDIAGCDPPVTCGDGAIDAGEQCDGANVGSQSCAGLGFTGGTLGCSGQCTLDTSGCDRCGNDAIDPAEGEVCDGADLAGQDCTEHGYYAGTLACTAACDGFDTAGCTGYCGNGTAEAAYDEACDDGVNDGSYGGCMPGCGALAPHCGDGLVQPGDGEVCDGTDLAGQDCTTLGQSFTGGTLACDSGCQWDTGGCDVGPQGPCTVTQSWTKEPTNPILTQIPEKPPKTIIYDDVRGELLAVYPIGTGAGQAYRSTHDLATSSDGVTWSAGSTFISPSDVGRTELKQITMWVDHSMQPPTYHLYVSATNDTVCHDAQDIYYLTSTSPPTWTNHGVVLSASEPHESRGIEPDHIVKRDQEYLLYYTAFDGSGCNITDKQVALATSSDGVSWQKQGLVIESSTRTTDTEGVGRARVFKRSDGFHMSYQEQDGTNNDIYYAWSADGLNWTRNDAPLIQGSQAWEGTDPRLWPIGFTNSNNQVELFYGAHDGSYQGAGLATTSTLCEFTCGNGVVEGLESCDDGGTTPGDGCDGQCQVELDWSCGGEPSLCTSDSDPTAYAPGTFIPVSIGGTSPRLNSVFRSAGGTLFVGADQDVSGNPRVARSNDGGQSWNTQLLSNAGQSTYRTSIFAIEPGLLGVCGTQGSGSPYDGFMQTSSNDGVSWSGTWDNVSVSSDYNGERYVFVVATPGGRYLAVFRCGTRLCARVHTSYSGWSSTTRFYVDDGTRVLGRPFPFTVGTDVYIAVVNRDDLQLRTYRSTNDGDSFSLIGESPVAEEMDQIRVFYHPVEDLIYLCGASMRNPAVNQRIYTYRSDDDGQTWGDEKLFVSGLDTDNIFTCHIDETGVYGGYQTTGGQIYIIPPGDRVLCGNGVMEPGELCDGADTGGMACGDVGFTTGTLGCASGCTQYDTSNCQ